MYSSLMTVTSAVLLLLLAGARPHLRQATLPSYTRALQLETTSDASANVSIGDVNGDGMLDLVLVKGRHGPGMSRVLLGDGHGHFTTAYDLSKEPYHSYSGTLVDMDRDGALDVVLSNEGGGEKLIFLNDGKGHFRIGSTFGSPAACSGEMYAGVPTDVPSCVRELSATGVSVVLAAVSAFAMPKSVTTAVPPESRTLSGLMSRCTTPRSCA